MSTKIYYAWRFKLDKLNNFLDNTRKQVFNWAETIVKRLCDCVTTEELAKAKKEHPYISDKNILKFKRTLLLLKESSKSQIRKSGLDVDFCWNIWIKDNYCYVVPIGEFTEFQMPNYVKDFCYFNNTDQPEDVSDKEWEKREIIWEEILGDTNESHNRYRLCYEIINNKDYDMRFEMEMEKRLS